MKIIFLDIDGALNSQKRANAMNNPTALMFKTKHKMVRAWEIALGHLHLLEGALRETEAFICVSSSWRVLVSNEELVSVFDHVLPSPIWEERILFSLPRQEYATEKRGQLCLDWLKLNPVEAHVAIDYSGDFPENFPLVKTTPYSGLMQIHKQQLIEILNGAT